MTVKTAIGIDIGGSNFRAALVSTEGSILEKIMEPSSGDLPGKARMAIERLAAADTVGVGVGVAGLIDREGQRIITSPNLRSMDGYSFSELGLSFPLVVENDANSAAFGELWAGSGKNFRSFILLTLGTGIGSGLIYQGKLLEVAAEPGHMSINAEGRKCPCGNYGCLELYSSARAITEAATGALEEGVESLLRECCRGNIYKITPLDVCTAALDGDGLAREILKSAGKNLGVGIANMINLFSPEAVVLTGGLAGARDIYLEEAMKEASRRAFKELYNRTEILVSSLGGDAGVIGAAGLVFERIKEA